MHTSQNMLWIKNCLILKYTGIQSPSHYNQPQYKQSVSTDNFLSGDNRKWEQILLIKYHKSR